VIEERGRNRVLVGVAWVAASLLLVVFLPPFAVASRLTARSCKPGGSHTLLATRTLRVYRTRTSGKTVLVTESPQYENNDVRLTAVKVAPGSTSVIGVVSSTVGVGLLETDLMQAFNVRSGHRLNSNEAELLSCEEGCDVSVLSFVVAPSGAFAFLGDVRAASTERPMGLYTIPVGHSVHLLEYGTPPQRPEPGVPTISDLAYANGLVSWSSSGSPMTAPIS
jgi:hypothetical protein